MPMPEGMRIRDMTLKDIPQAAALELACFETQAWSAKALSDALASPDAMYLVAENGGEVFGMCGCWRSYQEAEVMNVAVWPAYRRQGLASVLLDGLIAREEAAGVHSFFLEVRAGNAAAIALYASKGFKEEGRRKHFYRHPDEDALLMARRAPR